MLKVYDAENLLDAQLVHDELRAGGLQVTIKGQYLSGAAGELPPSGMITVWIAEPRHEARARGIIEDFEKARRDEPIAMYCGSCGEWVEGNFSRCWNCSAWLNIG